MLKNQFNVEKRRFGLAAFTLLMLIFLFVLSGCAQTTEETPEPLPAVDRDQIVDEETDNDVPSADATIVVYNQNRIDPNEIRAIKGQKISIAIYNQGDYKARIEIPTYGSQVNIDVDAGQYEVVEITPGYAGIVAIELNGIQVGRFVVE